MTASAFSSFAATLLKWGTASSAWKTSDEYSLSRNTNFRRTVQVCHFFLGSINFQCMFSLVDTVYCQKQPPEVFCKTSILKNLKNSQENTCVGIFHRCFPVKFTKFLRTTILKNICQRLLLYCTLTACCYLPILIYIQYLLPHHQKVATRSCSVKHVFWSIFLCGTLRCSG